MTPPGAPEQRGPPSLQVRLTSAPHEIRTVLGEARAALAPTTGGAQLDRLELVLAEVLNNISEHAYGAGREGPIDLEIGRAGTDIWCRLTDSGRGMPEARLPQPREADPADRPLDDLPEGGFGWRLIHDLTGRLEYARSGRRNHLFLTISDLG